MTVTVVSEAARRNLRAMPRQGYRQSNTGATRGSVRLSLLQKGQLNGNRAKGKDVDLAWTATTERDLRKTAFIACLKVKTGDRSFLKRSRRCRSQLWVSSEFREFPAQFFRSRNNNQVG
jgi:hypothetical protein